MSTIFSHTAEKLIQAALEDPLKEFKEIELIQAAGVGKGAGADCIAALGKEGVLWKHRVGRAKIISLHLATPATFFLKNFFAQRKLQRLSPTRLATIALFRDQVQESTSLLVVFGSTVAGDATSGSDIDLLVISKDLPLLESARKKAEEWFGERLNLHVYHEDHEEDLGSLQQDVFMRNALLQGVILVGYDLAAKMFSSLAGKGKKDLQRIEYFRERMSALRRNYAQNDHGSVKEIADRLQEQLVFFILSREGVAYASKRDAAEALGKMPEGKIFKALARSALKRKIELLDTVVKDILVKEILKEEQYGA